MRLGRLVRRGRVGVSKAEGNGASSWRLLANDGSYSSLETSIDRGDGAGKGKGAD